LITLSFRRNLILILAVVCLIAADPVTELKGKVVRISDGDTFGLLIGKETFTIRLEGIDAPESTQAFGTKAKYALRDLVAGKEVMVRKTGEDEHKRTLGVVYIDKTEVNSKLVQDGWAWHYKQYNKDPELAKLETEAREAKRGIWADKNVLEPWEFRRRKNAKNEPVKIETAEADPAKSSPKASTPTPRVTERAVPAASYWLNTSTGIRHNSTCEHFNKTKKGRFCSASDGKGCKLCGG
jgi:endonuclease YncB( thermonuclease family)